jgi:hypothetical protein
MITAFSIFIGAIVALVKLGVLGIKADIMLAKLGFIF